MTGVNLLGNLKSKLVEIEIISAPQKAAQKPLKVRESLHLSVSLSIAALIMRRKKPKETMEMGKVRIFTRLPMKVLIRPKRKATLK